MEEKKQKEESLLKQLFNFAGTSVSEYPVGSFGSGQRSCCAGAILLYLADNQDGDPGKAQLCPGTGNSFLWMACRRLCTVRDVLVYCRTDVFPYGGVSRAGNHAVQIMMQHIVTAAAGVYG